MNYDLNLCPDCGHGTCTCGFDCECGCTWAAHDSGGSCDDCQCGEFTEEGPIYRNPLEGLWAKRNTPSGHFADIKRSGDVFKGIKREN